MIYDLRHVTTYRYGSPVTFAQCALRVTPSTGPGQTVQNSRLVIEPTPSRITEHRSFFGNLVSLVQIVVSHSTLRVTATARVDVRRKVWPAEDLGPPWEAVRESAFATTSLRPSSPSHFIYASALTGFSPEVTAYAQECFTPGRPIIPAAKALMSRIRREFKYDPDATRVSTPLIEAFRNRHGVCQDFAHVMIAGLRGLGVPTAYVSGYIRTLPPTGQPRLEGGDASHAWVSVWCGAELGWLGLDPTNDLLAGDDHIVLAGGRDYADVAPVGGILQGASKQDIDVAVDVIPIAESLNAAH